MKVSIIMPLYNQVATARWTWRSAAMQTYQPTELIIVNDGSTDENCAWHAKLFKEKVSPFAKYIELPSNQGVVAARNCGAREATGDALLFLDADDWIDRSFLDQTVPRLRDDVGIVQTAMHVFSESEDSIVYAVAADLELLKKENVVPITSLVRRDAFWGAGGFKADVYEDWELWLSIAKNWKIATVQEPLFHYRKHSRSESRISGLVDRHEELVGNMRRLHPEVFGA